MGRIIDVPGSAQHRLKITADHWRALNQERKTHEVRVNDRQFQRGDALLFDVVDADGVSLGWDWAATYRNRFVVTHVLDLDHVIPDGTKGWVVLSVAPADADYWETEAWEVRQRLAETQRTLRATRGALTRTKNRLAEYLPAPTRKKASS